MKHFVNGRKKDEAEVAGVHDGGPKPHESSNGRELHICARAPSVQGNGVSRHHFGTATYRPRLLPSRFRVGCLPSAVSTVVDCGAMVEPRSDDGRGATRHVSSDEDEDCEHSTIWRWDIT